MKVWDNRGFDWGEVQVFYDQGHNQAECIQEFGFGKGAWWSARRMGKLKADPSRKPPRWSNKPKDITGMRFGRLVAVECIKSTGRFGGGRLWLCQCDCGKTTTAVTARLLCGDKGSCGCLHRPTGKDHPSWKGCGDISGGFWGTVLNNAKIRGIEVGITIEDAWNLFTSQNRKCAISGVDIGFGANCNMETTASLDRIDSRIGYIIGNVQWVHKCINLMKLDHSMSDLLGWVETIHQFQCNKKAS